MGVLKKINSGLARGEWFLLSICLLSMLFVAFFQVVMRNFFDSGYIWADQFARLMVLWVGLLGAAIATSENHHLTIDVVTKFLPERIERFVRLAITLFAMVVSVFISKAAVRFVLLESKGGDTGLFNLPLWITEAIIPFSFILIAIHFFILALIRFCELFGPAKGER